MTHLSQALLVLPFDSLLSGALALLLLSLTLGRGLFIWLRMDQAQAVPSNPFSPHLSASAILLLILIATPLIAPLIHSLLPLIGKIMNLWMGGLFESGNVKQLPLKMRQLLITIPLFLIIGELIFREIDRLSDRTLLHLSQQSSKIQKGMMFIIILPLASLIALIGTLILSQLLAKMLLSMI